MPECMQRRLIMLMCLDAANALTIFSEKELCVALNISMRKLIKTKALFLENEFISENWELTSKLHFRWRGDSSTERVRQFRKRKKMMLKETVT